MGLLAGVVIGTVVGVLTGKLAICVGLGCAFGLIAQGFSGARKARRDA